MWLATSLLTQKAPCTSWLQAVAKRPEEGRMRIERSEALTAEEPLAQAAAVVVAIAAAAVVLPMSAPCHRAFLVHSRVDSSSRPAVVVKGRAQAAQRGKMVCNFRQPDRR